MHRGGFDNLILTGFMGTGKTTVGRAVAQRLARSFVDMDQEIERRAGKSIPRIFAEDGESAFRHMEAALCEELSALQGPWSEDSSGLVIATGGGALVDPVNRQRMLNCGTVICLTCGVSEILQRLNTGDDSDRPLLEVVDPRAEIERLLGTRQEAYAAIPWQIDTTDLALKEVMAQVIAIASAITLNVRHPSQTQAASQANQYPIHIGNGLLAHLGSALRAAGIPADRRVAVVSNPVVAPLYGAQVERALQAAGFQPFACFVPDGEQRKTLSTVSTLYEQFLDGGLDRGGVALSLGGGVTGDIAGFAAASFMRGVPFAQVPTTLLAMVDASVGGKTGIDLPQGKNLVGAFKQPLLVLIDPNVLSTLPADEIRSGMAEVLKHGIIAAPDLFVEMQAAGQQHPLAIATEQLARALRVKIQIVEQDPFEDGRRAVLNLGHTVGHALEKLSDYSLRHGEAISIGIVAAARIAAQSGRADPSLPTEIEAALSAWELPVCSPPFSSEAVWDAMAHDKKRRGGQLHWVLPHAIGQVKIVEDVSPALVKAILRDLGCKE